MGVSERLLAQRSQVIREEIRRREDQQPEFQEVEEGYYMYMEREPSEFINASGSVFSDSVFATKDMKSLNTAPSVFDRTAIFHTTPREEET